VRPEGIGLGERERVGHERRRGAHVLAAEGRLVLGDKLLLEGPRELAADTNRVDPGRHEDEEQGEQPE